ncbi:unnamed protein product [Nippostrongylus brasiliensis]|uniref:Uncharacterized protein n=1 Tax=Nippostrongylus brasiliensis TaxID=27835 RepID=A0A158QZ55_NIPBR|nr:unnamed protein product [Nippostrongylus brasiliensis]
MLSPALLKDSLNRRYPSEPEDLERQYTEVNDDDQENSAGDVLVKSTTNYSMPAPTALSDVRRYTTLYINI